MSAPLRDPVELRVGPLERRHARFAKALLHDLAGVPAPPSFDLADSLVWDLTDAEVERLRDLLEAELAERCAGEPLPPFAATLAAEAAWWAEWASLAEVKHYALACFRRLPAADRVGFLRAAQKVALA